MTNALAKYDKDQLAVIKENVAKNASNVQLQFFLEVCARRGLDPLLRQIHWTPRGIIVAIDGLRLIAKRTGKYRPGATKHILDENGKLERVEATVWQLFTYPDGSHDWHEVTEEATLKEYIASTPTWNKMPRVMLAKCAEARALRRAFPDEMGGLYAESEMDQANNNPEAEAPKQVGKSLKQIAKLHPGNKLKGTIDVVLETAESKKLSTDEKYDLYVAQMKDTSDPRTLKKIIEEARADKALFDDHQEGLEEIKETEKKRIVQERKEAKASREKESVSL